MNDKIDSLGNKNEAVSKGQPFFCQNGFWAVFIHIIGV